MNGCLRPYFILALLAISTGSPSALMAQTVSAMETEYGVASNTNAVTTSSPLNGTKNHLYVASVCCRPFEAAQTVTGLGLSWIRLKTQCGGRNQSGIDLWVATGNSSDPGAVSASYEQGFENAVITVTRYAGVDAQQPITAITSANTNGLDGPCSGGVDSSNYLLGFPSSLPGSRTHVSVSHRNRSHEPGEGYIERVEASEGDHGATTSLSVSDRLWMTDTVVSIDGTFNQDVDWAVVALQLKPSGIGRDGLWMSVDDIRDLPMTGEAWDSLEDAAYGDLGIADISDYGSKHDVLTLSVALVYARTGDDSLREKAKDAIMSSIGTEDGTTEVVQVGRNVVCYVIAADLMGLSDYDFSSDQALKDWLDELRYVVFPDGSLIDEDSERANNHGRMSGASRVAIALYLEDQVELDQAANVFRGFVGDRSAYDSFLWRHDLSWQSDETRPVGINPVGAIKDGVSIDGALPEEMRRGCSFQTPPCYTNYPWEGLQGALVEAVLLSRAGFDAFEWESQALLRAVLYLEQLAVTYPSETWWSVGDDSWIPYLVNSVYGTSFPTPEKARIGKCMGFTDWTHAASPRHRSTGIQSQR